MFLSAEGRGERERCLAQALEFEALLYVLERRAVLKLTEVLEEIKRRRKAAAKAQGTRQGSS